MSLKSDDLDLNSDVVPAEQDDDVNPSESAVKVNVSSTAETLASSPLGAGRVDEGLGTPDGGGNIGEAEMGLLDGGNGGKEADSSPGGEIGGNDGGLVLGLKGNVQTTDAYCGDSKGSGKNEGVEEKFNALCEEAVLDGRSGEGCSASIEAEGKVFTGDGTPVCKKGKGGNAGLQPVEEEINNGAGGLANPDLESGDTNPILITVDYGPSVAEAMPDDSGIGAADQSADKEMGVEMLADVDENKGLGDVTGGAADEWANKEMKGETAADVDEIKGLGDVTGVSQHAAVGDTDSHVHGVGLNGNQDLVNKEQGKDIEHWQDVQKKNVKKASFKLKECRTEEEGEFRASDLVWGKVRSHPWWPGQIFDRSDSTETARRYSRKDGFLVAYFGDRTFAWNDASRIKPFRAHFSQMEKQSNSEAFHRAVDCALDEVSRRMQFGLSCSCVSKEVYDKIKTQVIVNAGICEESSKRDGGDEFSSVSSFMPASLLQYLKAAAVSPFGGTNRLEFVVARAQLLAFKRWKGCYQLPEFKILGGFEEEDDVPVLGEREDSKGVCQHGIDFSEDNVQVTLGKDKSVIQDSARKRKDINVDGLPPSKKEKRMSDLMSESPSNLSNSGTKPKAKAEMKLTPLSSVKKRKAGDPGSDDSKMKNSLSPVTKRQFSRVGESMCRVASKLAASTPILKDVSGKRIDENGSSKRSRISSERSQRRKVVPAEYPPPEDILSQLCVAARDPMQEYSFLTSVISFFSDYRNLFCLENSTSRRKSTGKKSSNSVTSETSWFEGMEDSYWTDRIVQTNPDEQALFELESPIKKGSLTVEPEAALESSPKLDSKQETAVVNFESEPKPAGHMDEKCEEEYTPTALILNFSDLDSVPSESNLNKVFSRYGPINELDTEVPKKSKRAKVVFKRRADAENAFSSPGKFNIFGPALVSYRLSYLPSASASKKSKKVVTSLDKNAT